MEPLRKANRSSVTSTEEETLQKTSAEYLHIWLRVKALNVDYLTPLTRFGEILFSAGALTACEHVRMSEVQTSSGLRLLSNRSDGGRRCLSAAAEQRGRFHMELMDTDISRKKDQDCQL